MIKINEVIIVEGKYDKIKLEAVADAFIIETNGFRIFSDKEKLDFIKKLAEKRGLLILTDSDSAGKKIRNYLSGCIDDKYIKHAYIPDILGREKRKEKPSKEGKLGVEGVEAKILINSLKRFEAKENNDSEKKGFADSALFYRLGLSGRPESKALKKKLLKQLNLPENLSSRRLIEYINEFLTYEEFINSYNTIKEPAINACCLF